MPELRNVLGCHTRVSTQWRVVNDPSQANECELRWKWRKCADFGLFKTIVIQSQIGTLKKYKRPIHSITADSLTENQRPMQSPRS